MRSADFGPTPGRQRKLSISCSRAGGFFMCEIKLENVASEANTRQKLSKNRNVCAGFN